MRISILKGLLFLFAFSILVGPKPATAQDDDLTPISASELIAKIKAGEYDHQRLLVQCDSGGSLDFSELVDPETGRIEAPIMITSSVIECSITAIGLDFNKSLNFTNTTFERDVFMAQNTFRSMVNMNNVRVKTGITLAGSIFLAQVEFESSVFDNSDTSNVHGLQMHRTTFEKDAVFRAATFAGPVSITEATFKGVTTFREAKFLNHDVIISDSTFRKEVNFTRAQFEQYIAFDQIVFLKSVTFMRATLRDGISFRGSSVVEGSIDITGISIGEKKLDLFDIIYERLIAHDFNFDWVVRSTNEFDTPYAIDAFAKLEANFSRQGRQTLANEAYYYKRDTECKLPKQRFTQDLECFIGKRVGYLVRLSEVLGFSLLSFVVAALVNSVLRAKQRNAAEHVELRIPAAEKLGAFTITARKVTADDDKTESNLARTLGDIFKDATELGFAAFISLRRSAVGAKTMWKAREDKRWQGWIISFISFLIPIIITLEWLLGLFVLFSLGVTLANTVPTLGELWTQIR